MLHSFPHMRNTLPRSCLAWVTLLKICAIAGEAASAAIVNAYRLAEKLVSSQFDSLQDALTAHHADATPRLDHADHKGTKLVCVCHRTGLAYHVSMLWLYLVGCWIALTGA